MPPRRGESACDCIQLRWNHRKPDCSSLYWRGVAAVLPPQRGFVSFVSVNRMACAETMAGDEIVTMETVPARHCCSPLAGRAVPGDRARAFRATAPRDPWAQAADLSVAARGVPDHECRFLTFIVHGRICPPVECNSGHSRQRARSPLRFPRFRREERIRRLANRRCCPDCLPAPSSDPAGP